MKAGPFDRPFDLRDVPTPDFIGTGRRQFVRGVGRVGELVATLGLLSVAGQQTAQGSVPNPDKPPSSSRLT